MNKNNTKLLVLVALLLAVGAVIMFLPSSSIEQLVASSSSSEQVEQGEAVEQVDSATIIKVDQQAPDFTVALSNGQSVTLSDLRGKVVLLNFWATWCPPCREELKRVQSDVIDRFASRDFVFLPISRGEESAIVVDFLKKNGYTFAAGVDTDESIYNAYAKQYIPRNYLINRHGVVVQTTLGYDPQEFNDLLQHVEMTLNAR